MRAVNSDPKIILKLFDELWHYPVSCQDMPMSSILYAHERRLIIEFYLGLRDEVARHYLRDVRIGTILVPVFGLVILGDLKDTPATASSIARSLGIPRATALRRLRELIAAGVVERRGNGNYCVVLNVINSPESLALHKTLVRRIRGIAQKLS